jgi:hypothetical protein
MRRPLLALSVFALQVAFLTPLLAQRPSFGGLVGHSLVGGGDSRVAVGPGVTGGDQAGLHLRAFADFPFETTPISFRTELFYNRLTSGASTYSANPDGKAALVDRTVGLTGSFVASTSRSAKVAPYFSLGAGVFTTYLGHNPNNMSSQVTESYQGMGMGLVAGGGLRIRVGRPTLLLDWRYYQALYNTRGSSFMPLSIGMGF